jgi:hypothetical protein
MGYSQSRKIENTDQKYLSLVQSYTLNPDTVKLLKKETYNYEKFIGRNPTKEQKVNLSAGKMFLEWFFNDIENPKKLSVLSKQLIDNIGKSKEYPRFLSTAYRTYAECKI